MGPSVCGRGMIGITCGGRNVRYKKSVGGAQVTCGGYGVYENGTYTRIMESFCIYMLSYDGHEWPKHFVLILVLIFKNINPLYHTSCVIDYPPTFLIYTHNGDDTP